MSLSERELQEYKKYFTGKLVYCAILLIISIAIDVISIWRFLKNTEELAIFIGCMFCSGIIKICTSEYERTIKESLKNLRDGNIKYTEGKVLNIRQSMTGYVVDLDGADVQTITSDVLLGDVSVGKAAKAIKFHEKGNYDIVAKME